MSVGDLVEVTSVLIIEQAAYLHQIGEVIEVSQKKYNSVIAVRFPDKKVVTFYTTQVHRLFNV